jgi:hypothetical protein
MNLSSIIASLLLTVVTCSAMAATDRSYYVTELAAEQKFDVYNDGQNTYLQSIPGLVVTGATADGEFYIVRGVPETIRGHMNGRPITVVHGAAPVIRPMPADPAALNAQIKRLDERLCILTNGKNTDVVCRAQERPDVAAATVNKDQVRPVAATESSSVKEETAAPAARSSTWQITFADKSVRSVLEHWSKSAGYQLLWEVPVDLELNANATITGTYEDALNSMLASLANSAYPVEAMIYENRAVRVVKRIKKDQL